MEGQRRKRRLWPWLAALAVLGGLVLFNYWPAEPEKIIISRETTYILGPLNPDGTVNYVKYLDDKCAEGVTPEKNAVPLLLRAFGPVLVPAEIRPETLRRLNLPADFFDGDKHYIKWTDRPGQNLPDANDSEKNDGPSSKPQAAPHAPRPILHEVYEMLLAGQVHPDLDAWLASNAGPLDLICQAAAKDGFYLPLVSTSTPPCMDDAHWVSSLGVFEEAAKALTTRAILKMARGDQLGAWDDVFAVHRLARLLGRYPSVIGQMVASNMCDIAAQAGVELATRASLTVAQLKELSGRLSDLGPATDVVGAIEEFRFQGLDHVMKASRETGVQALITGAQYDSGLVRLDWNQMLRDMNSWFDRMIAPLRLPRFQGRIEAQKAFDDESNEFATKVSDRASPLRVWLLARGGGLTRRTMTGVISDHAVCMMMPKLAVACDLEDKAKMTFEIETLAVALACFHAEHGRWPAKLKELCPSLLKEIPADRFSTSPLIYRPSQDGYLLYSVGRNLRDDGGQCDSRGSGKSSDERKDDIVAEVKPGQAVSNPAASPP